MEWTLEDVSSLILELAKIALRKRDSLEIHVKNTDLSSKNELYTDVDLEVEEMLRLRIEDRDKGIFVLGEESATQMLKENHVDEIFSRQVWVVDPIDGTRNYASGLPTWGISIGLIEQFEFKEGAIILPDLGESFISHQQKIYHYKTSGSLLEQETIHPTEYKVSELPEKPSPIRLWVASDTRQIQTSPSPYKSHLVRSCVFAIGKVLTNSYFAFTSKANLWDYAGGIGLFRNAGKRIYFYNKESQSLEALPWKIDREYWGEQCVRTQNKLVFCLDREAGLSIFPKQNS